MTLDNLPLEKRIEHFSQLLAEHRMGRFRTDFLAQHAFDQVQVFKELSPHERKHVYDYISPEELADLFDSDPMEENRLKVYFSEMNAQYAASTLSFMKPDNAVYILNEIDDTHQVSSYLTLMPSKVARELSTLLNYTDHTAGALMTTDFVSVSAKATVGETIQYIKKEAIDAETIYYVYVVNDVNQIQGVISLRDLIVHSDEDLVSKWMRRQVISVNVNEEEEEVARTVQDYNLLAIPVTGYDNELLGIVTIDDIVDVLDDLATANYSGLAAVDVDEDHDTPLQASEGRLPWLITLLFLGMGTATLIGKYETLIEQATVLSAFITLITGTAGNAGTQSLAVAVRKLTNKDEDDGLFSSFGFELMTGVLTGLIVGVTIALIAGVWKQNIILGLIIGIAMMCAIIVANLAGALVPKLMDKIGFDPAVASGPFISTLSDLTSVLIYFSIASFFLDKL